MSLKKIKLKLGKAASNNFSEKDNPINASTPYSNCVEV